MLNVHLNGTYRATRAFDDMTAGRLGTHRQHRVRGGGAERRRSWPRALRRREGRHHRFTKALLHELGPSGVTSQRHRARTIDTPLIHGAGALAGLYDAAVARPRSPRRDNRSTSRRRAPTSRRTRADSARDRC